MHARATRILTALTTVLALVVFFKPAPAHACGGFFCNNMSMDQTGEQIVFGVDGPTVTATIQIAFAGDADDFGWVIPVLQAPEISLAPRSMFTTLRGNTEPSHWLQWDYSEGSCGAMMMAESGMDDSDFADPAPNAGGAVNVIDASEVGPYDTVTLESNDAEALFEWLNDNGFVQPEEVQPLIEHYLDLHYVFVAMKLKQGTGTGEIQPVTLSFTESEPCVPLVLTQIAAQPDMPVLIWNLSDAQAV
ncbi:MAG: DUF2330 domain-containing protein, partial [Myxococcota bacterium]|nr:DUF2330 domain-containing protein [Myxococcota bacterium]